MEIDEDVESIDDYVRTVDDVKLIVQHAKLDQRNLTNITQAIYYPNTDEDTLRNFKLLEVDAHILGQIKEGQTLAFKGGLTDKVVLCTETKTYEVKEAEISNSLLLVPHLKFAQATSKSPIKSPKSGVNTSMDSSMEEEGQELDTVDKIETREILKIFHEYYECREIKPRLRKIVELLDYSRYAGPEKEHLIEGKVLFRYDQLFDTVQCSPSEFNNGLVKYRAIEIDGRMRMLDNEYEYRLMTLMTGLITENSWNLNEIDKKITIDSLEGIAPFEVVDGIFDVYTEKNPTKPGKFKYKEDMICALFAEKILQQGLKFHVDDFLTTWQDGMPEGFTINDKYLKGIGVVDRESNVPCVRGLKELNLPLNIHDRLRILFKTKEKWNLEQIEPYVECFTTPSVGVTAILAKYTRSLVVNGIRIYVSKH